MVLSSHGTIEYVIESAYGAFPTNPTMLWLGIVQKANLKNLIRNEDYRGLKAQGAANRLQIAGNVKTGADLELDLEYQPQDWTFFKRAMSSSGGLTLTDTLSSISFGVISNDSTPKYAQYSGGVINEIMVDIPEDKLAKVTAKVLLGHVVLSTNDPWSTTYIGAGAHASASAGAALGFNDITTLTLGGAAFKATNVKFGIKSNLKLIKDPSSTNWANVVDIVPQKRDLVFSATVRRAAMNDFAVKTFGYGANDIVLTIGGTTFTFANAKIPEEAYNLLDEGVNEMDVNFAGITSLVLS